MRKHFMKIVAIAFAFSMAAAITLSAQTDEPDYSSLFPQSLPGWTAGKVDVKTIKQQFGGLPVRRIQLVREYTSDKSNSQVEIVIDSFDIPGSTLIDAAHTDQKTLADLKGKAKLHDLRGNKGLELYDERSNLQGVSVHIEDAEKASKASPMLVLAVMRKNASVEELMSYVERVDLEKIRAFPWDLFKDVPPLF